jgi:hypothetical protein
MQVKSLRLGSTTVRVICEFWCMPDARRRWPLELYSKELEVPGPPTSMGVRSYWDDVASEWLDDQLKRLASAGPKRAQVRDQGKRAVLGTADRDHRS